MTIIKKKNSRCPWYHLGKPIWLAEHGRTWRTKKEHARGHSPRNARVTCIIIMICICVDILLKWHNGDTRRSAILVWIFQYQPSILGYHHLWKRSNIYVYTLYVCVYIYIYVYTQLCSKLPMMTNHEKTWKLWICQSSSYLIIFVALSWSFSWSSAGHLWSSSVR